MPFKIYKGWSMMVVGVLTVVILTQLGEGGRIPNSVPESLNEKYVLGLSRSLEILNKI